MSQWTQITWRCTRCKQEGCVEVDLNDETETMQALVDSHADRAPDECCRTDISLVTFCRPPTLPDMPEDEILTPNALVDEIHDTCDMLSRQVGVAAAIAMAGEQGLAHHLIADLQRFFGHLHNVLVTGITNPKERDDG